MAVPVNGRLFYTLPGTLSPQPPRDRQHILGAVVGQAGEGVPQAVQDDALQLGTDDQLEVAAIQVARMDGLPVGCRQYELRRSPLTPKGSTVCLLP